MKKETENKVQKIIGVMHDAQIDEEIKEIKEINPVDMLRQSIFSFLEKRLSKILEQEVFKSKIQERVLERIGDPEEKVTFKDLLSLLRTVYDKNNSAVASFLSLLKPSFPDQPNPLLQGVTGLEKTDEDTFKRLFDNANPAQLEKINKVYKYLAVLAQQGKEDEEDETK